MNLRCNYGSFFKEKNTVDILCFRLINSLHVLLNAADLLLFHLFMIIIFH